MRSPRLVSAFALLLGVATMADAQSAPTAAATSHAAPVAAAADVETIDGIMAAIYDVISGPAGQRRNWDRFRSLMAPNARLIPTGRRPDGSGTMRSLTVEEYVTQIGPRLEQDGFYERELGRKTERFGNVVHLMSAYDSKRTPQDAEPFTRGVNSFQLWFDGKRWWVVTIFWEAESAAAPIPAELLRGRP